MSNKFNFTKRDIEKVELPEAGKRAYYWDTLVAGLALDVTGSGTKTFYFRKTVNYKRQIVLIGPYPQVSLEQARARALELGSKVALGTDAVESQQKRQAQITLGQLLDAYLEGHARQHCAAAREIEAVYRRYLTNWMDARFASIGRPEVQARLNEIGRENGHVAANHCLTYTRAAINWCIKQGVWKGANPFVNVTKFKTQPRERFLRPDELESFFKALDKNNNSDFRDYVYLSLFTGARRSNVLSMRWDQINFDLAIWYIPRTKSGESQTIPLTANALEILRGRKSERVEDEPWVFPGSGNTGHLVEPKRAWHAFLDSAGISDLRLHDMRRTLGSYMARGNQSLHIIGKALGHKSPTSTQIYSRMTTDPIRNAMETAQSSMLKAGKRRSKTASKRTKRS